MRQMPHQLSRPFDGLRSGTSRAVRAPVSSLAPCLLYPDTRPATPRCAIRILARLLLGWASTVGDVDDRLALHLDHELIFVC